MDKTKLIRLAAILGTVLAYILLKWLAATLNVDLGEVGALLRGLAEFALPAGTGALLFSRPSDAAALPDGP